MDNNQMKYILVKLDDDKYILFEEDQNGNRKQLIHKLSHKNCQAIERGYDLDELAAKVTEEYNPCNNDFEYGVKKGFQKALEILGYRRFTEDDMAREIHLWDCHINVHEEDKGCLREIYKRVKSLQQNEWEVLPDMTTAIYSSNLPKKGEQRPQFQFKYDNLGCLILKPVI